MISTFKVLFFIFLSLINIQAMEEGKPHNTEKNLELLEQVKLIMYARFIIPCSGNPVNFKIEEKEEIKSNNIIEEKKKIIIEISLGNQSFKISREANQLFWEGYLYSSRILDWKRNISTSELNKLLSKEKLNPNLKETILWMRKNCRQPLISHLEELKKTTVYQQFKLPTNSKSNFNLYKTKEIHKD